MRIPNSRIAPKTTSVAVLRKESITSKAEGMPYMTARINRFTWPAALREFSQSRLSGNSNSARALIAGRRSVAMASTISTSRPRLSVSA